MAVFDKFGGGGVAESGSNADGDFIKFTDGTMICTKTLTGLGPISTGAGAVFFSGSIAVGNWAEAFVDVPEISITSAGAGALSSWVAGAGAPTTTAGGTFFLVRHSSSAATSYEARITAVGKWK